VGRLAAAARASWQSIRRALGDAGLATRIEHFCTPRLAYARELGKLLLADLEVAMRMAEVFLQRAIRRLSRWSAMETGEFDSSGASERLAKKLYEHDVQGEKAIAVGQGLICCLVLGLHVLARVQIGLDMVNPWVVSTLGALIGSSMFRLYLTHARTLPNRTLDVLNVVDIGIFLLLIWSYQYAYQHPAGGVLKAPSFSLLFVLVALRALRFHPRPIVVAGATAIVGWMVIVYLAVSGDDASVTTRDYNVFLSSHRVLLGAEFEKVAALIALVACLATATSKARQILGKAAHAADYAEALAAAQRHLEEATAAKEKAETAVVELDRRDAELSEQNRRFNVALANMSQGISMYDKEQRLLVCNDRYLNMYRLPQEMGIPGTKFREVVDCYVGQGVYCGDDPQAYIEERLAEVLATEPYTTIKELRDGRVVAIKHQPMEQGGWVATHEDITQQRRAEARISHMARHDALTNLPNRVQLRERMDDALYGAHDDSQSLALLVLNIDRFKEINDTLGHSVGDTLLQLVAERLREQLGEVNMVARIGGDEFAVLEMSDKPAERAAALAKRLQAVISEPLDIDGQQFVIGASVGIAIAPTDGNESDQLLKNADLALDRAKSDRRGTYSFYEREMDERLQARRHLEQDLRLAIANGEFEVFYQPQLNLARNEISGCEALLRWRHPLRGLISPVTFIPVAEETGLIVEIGEWVLHQACADASAWPRDINVAVNVSAIQLKRGDVLRSALSALNASGLSPKRLELEVTESVLLDEHRDVLETLQRLHILGVRISLDDFGTGYSSLGYLKRFPFDKIKLDRSFVSELFEKTGNSGAIVRTVAALGSNLGIATTAEGVETEEQLDLVRKEGYTEIQGYYLSPPVPVGDLGSLFSRRIKGAA
jgi:diguanylate cyclase (GGDEF)-like protein